MISDREFTDIWTEAQPGLRSYALWLSRNPLLVDDLVQQTASQAWESLRRSERYRTGEELVGSKEHLKPHADTGTYAAVLLGQIFGPGDTGAHFHDEPLAQHGLSISEFCAVVVKGHGRISLAVDLQL